MILGLHSLLQPTRIGNPGVAAYKAPPATIVKAVSPARMMASQSLPEFIEPIIDTPPAAVTHPTVEPKKVAEVKPERAKRRQPARRREVRSPRHDFAFQPFFGGGFWR
jgi:hypothetical protein